MAGTGKFAHVVKATSHMRSPDEPSEDVRTGEGTPDPPAPPNREREAGERKGPGRPRSGKRSNPGFQQVTALLPSEVYSQVRIKLIEEKSYGDFSELLKVLLENWLLAQGRGPQNRP